MSTMLLKKNIFSIIKVANFLKKNKVGVIPTDTVYGISGIVPTSASVVSKEWQDFGYYIDENGIKRKGIIPNNSKNFITK